MGIQVLQVELTNACNLSCVECPHRKMKRLVRNMTDKIFDKVLSTFVKDKDLVCIELHKDGEPLLFKKLQKYISKIVSINKCSVGIYTNGLLLTNDFIDFLGAQPNPMRLLVSFHLYNHNGVKNDYKNVYEAMLYAARKHYTNIELVAVTHKTKLVSQAELDEWQSFWTQNGVEKNINGIFVNDKINKWAGLIPEGNTQYPYCSYLDVDVCVVGNTGNILPCCTDLEEEIVFGNIMTDNISTIMQKRTEFYDKLAVGVVEHPLCQRCIG